MPQSRRSRWLAIDVILGVVVVAVGSFAGYQAWYRLARNWSSESMAETRRRGDLIVQQIVDYHARHGTLPPTLAAVGSNLPEPTAGLRQWIYTPNAPVRLDTRSRPSATPSPATTSSPTRLNFELRINASPSGYPTIWYTHADSQWHIDT
ncbi:MAG: hypothetical protein MUE97_08340 [Phycisphaerales bacterium]|jgi:hypothetical protein|nr:hypothetical protein [Phycisphaerales bacterium]